MLKVPKVEGSACVHASVIHITRELFAPPTPNSTHAFHTTASAQALDRAPGPPAQAPYMELACPDVMKVKYLSLKCRGVVTVSGEEDSNAGDRRQNKYL